MSKDLVSVTRDSARGSFFLAVGNILSAVIQAVGVFIVARLLGPELYGVYTLSLVVPLILLNVADFGVNQGLIKFSASMGFTDEKGKIASFLRNAFLFKLLLGLAVSCLAILFSEYFAVYVFNRPEVIFYIRIASISILLSTIAGTATSAFIGLDRAEYSALTITVQAATKTLLSILLVMLGLSLTGAVIGFVLGALAAALAGTIFLIKIYKQLFSLKENSLGFNETLKALVGYGFPIYLSALFTSLIPEFQSIILSMYTTNTEIGNFKASLNFITLINLLTLSIATALFPAFSKLDKNGAEIRKFFSFSMKYTTLLIVPASTAMIIFSKQIIQIIYGPEYVLAPTFLALHSLLFLLAGLGFQVLNSLFNGLNETFITLKMGLTTFLVFILLGPALTMQYSVPGMIIAIITSNLTATVYGAYKAKTKFRVEYPYKNLLPIYLAAALSAASAFLILETTQLSTILKLTLAATAYIISYITLLPLTRAINKREIDEIRTATQKVPLIKPPIILLLKYQAKIALLNKNPALPNTKNGGNTFAESS